MEGSSEWKRSGIQYSIPQTLQPLPSTIELAEMKILSAAFLKGGRALMHLQKLAETLIDMVNTPWGRCWMEQAKSLITE